jgi:hypothetical protein
MYRAKHYWDRARRQAGNAVDRPGRRENRDAFPDAGGAARNPGERLRNDCSESRSDLKALILGAALGTVPQDKTAEKKHCQSHGQTWFKTIRGGRELAGKVFSLGIWPMLEGELMPFCNAVRKALDLEEIPNLKP